MTSKLRLALDDLAVESFDAGAVQGPRGTVAAHAAEADTPSVPCTNKNTCQNTCGCPTWADNSCYPQTYCIG